jgi:hypothetical protein
MKLKKEIIKRLIDTLKEIDNNLKDDEYYDFKDHQFSLLPDKFIIKVCEDNKVELNKFLHKYCTDYIGYDATIWHCLHQVGDSSRSSCYLAFPQYEPQYWVATNGFQNALSAGYKEINIDELKSNYKF